jgi:type I restriction enzyme S subunit
MSELSRVKLSDVAKVSTGFAFKGNEYRDEGIRVVRGENVSLGELRWDTIKCWNQPFSQLEKYSLCDGDIVIGMDGSRVGRNRAQIKKSDLPLLLAQRVARVNAKEGYSQDLIAYIIKSSIFEQYVTRVHTGTSIPHISQKQIEDFSFDIITDYRTQTAIAEILSSLDDKIELNNKINQELEDLAQTLFKRWFIDFEFPNENGDPYKSSGGEMVDSELGEIPKGWGVKSLDEIAELIRGISYRKHELVSKEDGVPFVNLKCFALDGTFRQDGLKYFKGKFKDSHVIQSNDILVAVTDLTQDRLVIGLPIVWQNEDIALPSLDVCIIRPQQKILKDFLLYEFRTHRYKSRIIEFANGSTVLHLSVKGLETYGIRIPSNDLVIQWCEIISPILKSIGENTKENIQLTTLRDTLLPKLISGELAVSQILNLP